MTIFDVSESRAFNHKVT